MSAMDAILDDAVADIKSGQIQAIVADIPAVVRETKSGYKTTEFWLTIAGLLALNLNGAVMTLPDKYQAAGSVVLGCMYVISRGFAKKGVPHVEQPVQVPEA